MNYLSIHGLSRTDFDSVGGTETKHESKYDTQSPKYWRKRLPLSSANVEITLFCDEPPSCEPQQARSLK